MDYKAIELGARLQDPGLCVLQPRKAQIGVMRDVPWTGSVARRTDEGSIDEHDRVHELPRAT
jgi:hypothetical protein